MEELGGVLTGGAQSVGLVRVGQTVRRPWHASSAWVQTLLTDLERAEFAGAPRALGPDSDGREVVSFIDGEVVCHGDLGPHNTVFRDQSAVAIIDWDGEVSPGRRAVDFAHAVWCFRRSDRTGGADLRAGAPGSADVRGVSPDDARDRR